MSPAKRRSARAAGSRPAAGARRERTPFELGLLAVSLLAIAGVLVTLLLSDVRRASGSPDLRARVESSARSRSGGATYEVTVYNAGGRTAEDVEIEVTVGSETRTLLLAEVRRRDEEAGFVVFPSGTTEDARAEILSYADPTG